MIEFKPLPPLERLEELFIVDPSSPSGLRFLVSRGSRKAGDLAGSLHSLGYWVVRVNKSGFKVHRVIHFMRHGVDPVNWEVDHIDRTKNNNDLANLRLTDHSGNAYNTDIRKDNTSGIKGVHFLDGRFRARITHRGHQHHLGVFDTIEEAAAARHAAEVRFGLRSSDSI